MNKYKIFYLLFFLTSAVLMIAYKSKLTSVLFVFSVVLPAVSLLLGILSLVLLKVRVEYRTLSAEKYENLGITVRIKNRFIITVSPAIIIGTLPLKASGLFEYQNILISVPPFSEVSIGFNSSIRYRGVFDCGIEKVRIFDLLKIFSLCKKINRFEKITIMPRKLMINPIYDTSDSDSETESVNSFSLDKNSFSSIREYRPEDSIKHIHWTMSAKQDKLMVKQFERSIGGACIIIPDFNEYFPFDEDNAECTDCIIEAMLAVNLSLISRKQTCVNLWYSSENKACEQITVKDNGDFSVLYDMMTILKRQDETFLPEAVAQSCTDIPTDAATVYFITSQIRRDFIVKMSGIELFKNRKIRILLLDSPLLSEQQEELADAIKTSAGIELWRIDKNDIAASLNNAIELYNKH